MASNDVLGVFQQLYHYSIFTLSILTESVLIAISGSCLINMCVVRVHGYYKVHFRCIWFLDIMGAAAFGHVPVRYDCICGLYIVRAVSLVDVTR